MSEPVTVSAGSLEALPPEAATVVQAGDRTVAVFNVDGDLVAVDGRCLHRGGPLAEGLVRDGVVTCPWHWWRYDLRTGERLGAPWLRLRRYPVRVETGEIIVQIPPPEAPASIREVLLRHAARWREEKETGP
jgi:nitrite reductase/ring-hydroxylating ferredoxin subunit